MLDWASLAIFIDEKVIFPSICDSVSSHYLNQKRNAAAMGLFRNETL